MAPTADAVVGMMDAAYFVGRKELLDYLNETLDLKLVKIEQTASGAVACQLFDIMYPRSIAMSKVNWGAKNDYEYVQNYKILQAGFNKHHVQRHVDVDKLIRAKYQDNLEFMQWFKAFFDQSGATHNLADYNPREVRTRGKGGSQYNAQFGGSGGGGSRSRFGTNVSASNPPRSGIAMNSKQLAPASPSSKSRLGAGATATAANKTKQPKSPGSPTSREHRPLRERQQPETTATSSSNTKDSSSGINSEQQQQHNAAMSALTTKNTQLESQVKELETKAQDLEVAVMDIEKERDFYFEKLRNVEVLLQVYQENAVGEEQQTDHVPSELVDKIFKVLYATPEDEVIVNNDGELIPAEELLSQELSDTL